MDRHGWRSVVPLRTTAPLGYVIAGSGASPRMSFSSQFHNFADFRAGEVHDAAEGR